jgi:hypothetical protein
MIKYTRHAKRRMKLYKISEHEIKATIELGKKTRASEGKLEFVHNASDRKLPIKVICNIIDNVYLIITCYSLKKGIGK